MPCQIFRKIASIILILITTASATPLQPTINILPSNGTNIFSERAAAAPPYPDSCKSNANCAWGYKCIEGTCYWGCDDAGDCLPHTYCAHCFACGKFANNCMNTKFRPCGKHLAYCKWNEQCCSGICGRRGWFGVGACLPLYRDGSTTKEVDGNGGNGTETGKDVE